MRWSGRTTLLALALVAAVVAIGPSHADGSVWANVEPGDVKHGDTAQSMEVLVEGVTDPTDVLVNVTSLADSGVDLSNASVGVTEPAGVSVEAGLARSDGTTLIRLRLVPETDTAPTQVTFGMRLEGLDTDDAAHARLDYNVTYEDGWRNTETFTLSDPDLPWVSPITRSEDLVTGQRNASQYTRVNLDGVQPAGNATVRVDLSTLRARNVSLSGVTVDARLAEPERNGTLRRVVRTGGTVELTLRIDTPTDVTIELLLRGLDTRNADPADGLRYAIGYDGPDGRMSGTTQPFGLYEPGEKTGSPGGPPVVRTADEGGADVTRGDGTRTATEGPRSRHDGFSSDGPDPGGADDTGRSSDPTTRFLLAVTAVGLSGWPLLRWAGW